MSAVDLASPLLAWYAAHARRLPWRGPKDPWAVWVSEIMLQQTRVDTVGPYWTRFMDRFPTPTVMADASEQEVLSQWQGLGYYRRARLLHQAAQQVRDVHGGTPPSTLAAFHALPGVGRYTAGAVMSIAHGLRAPILDGNVTRVLCRVFRVEGDPQSSANQRRLWALAEQVLPREGDGDCGDFNQALMDLGATLCTPSVGPSDCEACPLGDRCEARKAGLQGELPAPRKKVVVKAIAAACAVLIDGRGRWLLARRPPDGLLAGLWEFPSVDTPPGGRGLGEDARALAAALAERVGVEIVPAALAPLGEVGHVFTHRRLTLTAFRGEAWSGRPRARSHYPEVRWVRPGAGEVPLPKATHKVIALLESSP